MKEQIEELYAPNMRLGRHINHDPRSLAFQIRPRASTAVSITHEHLIPVLDQGSLGSCTGNATVAALGTSPYYQTIPDPSLLNESMAVRLYSKATSLDSFPGSYPPEDTGSDGLSVAKAAVSEGLISGYLHATSLDATVTALQAGPVICGVNWYEGFDVPDQDGLVKIQGKVRGGHEFCLYGVDMVKKQFIAVNSWGQNWGRNGSFYISFTDFAQLLKERGDVTSFVPNDKPAPTPVPLGDDAALWSSVSAWAKARHTGSNRKAAAEVTAWAKKKGLA